MEALTLAETTSKSHPGTSLKSRRLTEYIPDPSEESAGLTKGLLLPWPNPLEPAALHGVAGEWVRRLDPHTETDPAANLFQVLVGVGNVIGRKVYFQVEADKHFCNLNCVLVGKSSKARKGTAWRRVNELLARIDPSWPPQKGGLSTGEGLIWAVRDPVVRINEKNEEELLVEGIENKSLLVVEEEFASVLQCVNRQGNTLSAVFRQAFDTGNLASLTKNSPCKATGAHISVIGHITQQELIRHLTNTECANGFANRILWVCVRRSKELPDGGSAHLLDFSDIESALMKAVAFAQACGVMRRDTEARELWHSVYSALSADKPGLFGAVTSRAEALVVRLSLIYAVLDCSEFIQRVHLEAALAAWRYCQTSAHYIFGDSLGDPDAEAILAELRQAGAEGLTRTEINEKVFQRHKCKTEIARALSLLAKLELADCKFDRTDGRPAERWLAK